MNHSPLTVANRVPKTIKRSSLGLPMAPISRAPRPAITPTTAEAKASWPGRAPRANA